MRLACSHYNRIYKLGYVGADGIAKGEEMAFEDATQRVLAFRDERDWEQFHNQKDLAISISLEAAELLELFQWSGSELELSDKVTEAKSELPDIVIYCVYLANSLGTTLEEAINAKIDKNEEKYPVAKAKGSAKKYTEL